MSSRITKRRSSRGRWSAPAFDRNLLTGRCEGNLESTPIRRSLGEAGTKDSLSSIWKHLAGNVLVLGTPHSADFEKVDGRDPCEILAAATRFPASFSQRQRCLLLLQSHGPDRLARANAQRERDSLVE